MNFTEEKMTTKFVFQFKNDEVQSTVANIVPKFCSITPANLYESLNRRPLYCPPNSPCENKYTCPSPDSPAQTTGYKITPSGGGKTPSLIELQNVGCEFDVFGSRMCSGYHVLSGHCDQIPCTWQYIETCRDRGYVVAGTAFEGNRGIPCFNGEWDGGDWISYFIYRFNNLDSFTDVYVAQNSIFHATATSPISAGQGYCHITIPGYTCDQLNFNSRDALERQYFVDSSGAKITAISATTVRPDTLTVAYVDATCADNKVRYPITNSTANFNPSTSRLEFIPHDNKDLGCQYHDGDNYVAFACNDDNTAVDVVQYKCGL